MSGRRPARVRRWPDKVIVGLTGNIATGKSAVSRMAQEAGALVLDADRVVHRLLDGDSSIQAAVEVAFGGEVRKPDGRIDRPTLAAIVFQDEAALRDLEAILHPAVRTTVIEAINESDASVVFIEAIKLLESPLIQECDAVWVTHCARVRQIERLMICRGMDDETAAMRVNAQPAQAEKVARADVAIDTDGTMADTRDQFEAAWSALSRQAERMAADRGAPGRLPAEDVRAPAAPRPGAATLEPLALPEETPSDVTVRRARPSDVPAVLLLMRQARSGSEDLKRAELLMSMSERSYLIGQQGAVISTVMGWVADSGVARVEQFHVYPDEAITITAPAVLAEIERTAKELICESILAFPKETDPPTITQLLLAAGFEARDAATLPRVWRRAVEESQPAGTTLLVKVLRNVRVA